MSKSGPVGVVEQNSPSVALLVVREVVEALGLLAGGKPMVDVGGTGLVVTVGGEMAASGWVWMTCC